MDDLPVEHLRLRPDAVLGTENDDLLLTSGRFQVRLAAPSPGRAAVLRSLSTEWVNDVDLTRTVSELDGAGQVLAAQMLVMRLAQAGWLSQRLSSGQRVLIDQVPLALGQGARPASVTHRVDTRYVLSRFALVHREDRNLVAQHPRSTVRTTVLEPGLAGFLVTACEPFAVADLAKAIGCPHPTAVRVLESLLGTGLVVDVEADQAESTVASGAVWSPFELMVHERARGGRHVLPLGGTYRLADHSPPAPARRSHPGAVPVALPVPDLDDRARTDPSLTEVIRSRRSVREHGAQPLTLDQLAEFLYRVQHLDAVHVPADGGQEIAMRPYPAGGSLGELELYAVVSRCDGLEPGVYHYESGEHRLDLLAPDGPETTGVLRFAQSTAATAALPQVLLVVTGRTDRIMWKYEGLGYTLLLKHAGVLTELMYLVATAMGLAPCALGTGDGQTFARLTGTDPVREPAVAEFLLGSLPGGAER